MVKPSRQCLSLLKPQEAWGVVPSWLGGKWSCGPCWGPPGHQKPHSLVPPQTLALSMSLAREGPGAPRPAPMAMSAGVGVGRPPRGLAICPPPPSPRPSSGCARGGAGSICLRRAGSHPGKRKFRAGAGLAHEPPGPQAGGRPARAWSKRRSGCGHGPHAPWGGRPDGPRAEPSAGPEEGTPEGSRTPHGVGCRWVLAAPGAGYKETLPGR